MNENGLQEIVLPALRGIMGDWVYYSCLMDLSELSSRVSFAREVHKNTALSDMIQRQLSTGRGAIIAEYLKMQPERFFNSLVVATYGGQPNWHALTDVRNQAENDELSSLSEETIASVGFLTFHGDENLFALDGQHRLAGIKQAMGKGLEQDPYDEVSVIFVAHKTTDEGLERTRRLFTTLNKTAKSVSKGDIIALDEDDVMAICARRLIEETELFRDDRIAFVANNNMPVANTTSLTTIGNLYDVLTILFTETRSDLRKSKADLQRIRPDDDVLDKYFGLAKDYFFHLRNNFMELDEFFASADTKEVVARFRGRHGGAALFRPIGIDVFTRVIVRLTRDMALSDAIKLASELPRNLGEAPYEWLMWDPNNRTMINAHKTTLREVLLYMLGKNAPRYPAAVLLERYRRVTGNDEARLPEQLG